MAINGIFILAELGGDAATLVREIQREFDPKLAAERPHPHITLAGSSGVGPVQPDTPIEFLRECLEPIAASTPRLELPLENPHQFMQTNIVVLPLDPHGPIRELHERIAQSGLRFGSARFAFTPHVTLSFYPTHTQSSIRRLLSLRVAHPAVLERIAVYHTRDPQPARRLFSIKLLI